MRRNLANFITAIRIICGVVVLFFPAFSNWFYIIYLLGGFTDAIDGTVARKLGQTSVFGARLDTVADIVLCWLF
jgi:Phosphatidylserine synthase